MEGNKMRVHCNNVHSIKGGIKQSKNTTKKNVLDFVTIIGYDPHVRVQV